MAIALNILLILLASGSILFYLACLLCTYQFFTASEDNSDREPYAPPVSILVPVCGVDAGAWENWSSLCEQQYDDYEVLFGVKDLDDPAIPVLEKLVAQYPARSRLLTGLEPLGVNHKDSNLSYLLAVSQHEIIILADSDIQVHPHYIRTVVAPLADPEVGLVTCAFVGRNPQSLGAAIASFGRCCDFIPSALIARIVDGGVRFAVGATMATRKSSLAKSGGLHMSRIGSDYNLGKRVAQTGYQVELSRYVLDSDTGQESVGEVYRRELRWARTIRYNRGPVYYTLIFCYGTIVCLPLLPLSGFAGWAIALVSATWLLRYLQVPIALRAMNCPNLLKWLWALPLRDILSLVIWAVGAFGRRVYWRGRWLQVEGDGLIRPWEGTLH